MAQATITPDQKAEAAKAKKAEKERQRKATIKAAQDALEKAGMARDTELDLDQRKRAAEAAEKKSGLTGKALQDWIVDGKTSAQAAEAGRVHREAKAAEERTRQNLTRSSDPEAAELAKKAKALAPDVKSAFLPKDARAFLDEILPKGGADGAKGLLTREVEVEAETPGTEEKSTVKVDRRITQTALKRFACDGEKDQDVRAHLTALGSGTRLWGRKLGLMILARIADEK